MAQNYFSIVTNIGRNKLALSAAGGAAVTITHFAIGDGNGAEVNPTAASTALVKEVWRTPVESVVIDPLNPAAILVTAIIPTTVGGWWMREFGIFDVGGAMIAVAKPVSQYKPTALEGQLEDIRYEFQIIIGETANVTMLVDPSVLLASRDFVEKRKVPVSQLSLTPWLPVKSMTVTAPPAAPATWDIYVIPTGATGAWAGLAQKLAEWNGSAWNIITPPEGHGISLTDGRVFEKIGGTYVEKIAKDVQSGKWNFAVAGGTGNALTLALQPVVTAYFEGLEVCVIPPAANTSIAPTLSINGLPAKEICRMNGKPLIAGEIAAGFPQRLIYSVATDRFVMVGSSASWVDAKFPYLMKSGMVVLDATALTVSFKNISFEEQFPNRCIGVTVTGNGAVSPEGFVGIAWSSNITKSGCTLTIDTNEARQITMPVPVTYIAFGD